MTQPLSNELPSIPPGVNFAPSKPLLALKDKNGHNSEYAQHYLTDAIKAKYNEKIKYKEQTFREIINVGQMTALFIEGKQILDWNPYSQTYAPRKLKNSDPNKIKAVNMMQYYCTQWQAKWSSSNPDIILGPLSNDDQDIARVRKANLVVDYLERQFYTSWYNNHEGLMAQVFGWYGNRIRTCNKNGKWFTKPIMGEREVQIGKGYGKCHDCEHSGTEFNTIEISEDKSMPICPKCGSTGVNYEPPVSQLMPYQSGTEQIRVPDIICEQLPFPACRWDPAFRAEESPWFIYEEEVPVSRIHKMLGNIRMPEGESGNKIGMDVMRELGQTGSPLSGRSGVADSATEKQKTGLITEMYLSADDLYDIRLHGDERTVGGENLPKADHASEIFKDGVCAVLLNGTLLVGLWPEHHSNSVTSGVYHMKPLSGTGRGVADAVEMQKRFNREDSANVRNMDARSRPAMLHMAGAISPQDRKLLGQSDVDIPVNMQNFPEMRRLLDVVSPVPAQALTGDVIQYTYNYLSDAMQRAYHTTGLGGANPSGVANNTATYAELTAQTADDLFTPVLSIKGDVRLGTAKKAFEKWCEINPVSRFVTYGGATKSGSRGMQISGEDVKGEYEWSVAEGSELPSDKLSKRKSRVAFYSLFQGGATGYFATKATNPQEVAEMEREFGFDSANENYDEAGEVCRTRFEMAKALMVQGMEMREQAMQQFGVELPPFAPSAIMADVRPSMLVSEPHLQDKALWFSNLLDTAEGIAFSDEERQLVEAFCEATAKLAQGQAIEIQTMENEVQVQSQRPIQENQMQQQQVQNEQQTADALQQGQLQHQQVLEADAQKHDQNLQNKAVDTVISAAQADAQQQNDLDKIAAQNKNRPAGA